MGQTLGNRTVPYFLYSPNKPTKYHGKDAELVTVAGVNDAHTVPYARASRHDRRAHDAKQRRACK